MRYLAIFILFIGMFCLFYFYRAEISNFFFRLPQIRQDTTKFVIEETKKEIFVPPPLRALIEAPEAFLTNAGIIEWTNVQRIENGLSALSWNPELDTAASLKVQNMLDRQYFSHVSPDGLGPDYWVQKAGYEYIVIGENLALGNFKDDKELVGAWMQSEGHRTNILNPKFREIGVAVKKGIFEGKQTWLAVQIFGKPLSSCPQPDASLKTRIETANEQLLSLKSSLETLRAEIENMRPRRGPDYKQKVEDYNALVLKYNALVEETKILIAVYNDQVQVFNACVSQ
ncbi:MAG: CAP domain-containing protein [Candidatus Paceibacteria bacterium]